MSTASDRRCMVCVVVAVPLLPAAAIPQWQVRGVKDIHVTYQYETGLAPQGIVPFGQGALFSGTSPRCGRELWRSDGTAGGTVLVQDLLVGEASAQPGEVITFGNLAVFYARTRYYTGATRLFVTDGTAAGTKTLGPSPESYQVARPARVGSHVWFSTYDPVHGVEPWRSDGTESGTAMVADLEPGSGSSFPQLLVEFRGMAAFVATTAAAGSELWLSDGTPAGTRPLDVRPGPLSSAPSDLVVAGSLLFFTADAGAGRELWCTDGTSAGTRQVRDIRVGPAGSQPAELTAMGSLLFFSADDGVSGQELWVSDGTTAGTRLVQDSEPGLNGAWPRELTWVGNLLLYRATTAAAGSELWRSDGTAAGTALVLDIDPRGWSTPSWLTEVQGTLYFAATQNYYDTELWRSDGTAAGTIRVKDILPGLTGSSPTQLAAVAGRLWFSAEDRANNTELWQSDGTASGTTPVSAITETTPAFLSDVSSSVASDIVCFVAEDDSHGRELWRSDGTAAGTFLLRDIYPFAVTNPAPTSLCAVAGLVLFAADNRQQGMELWVTDGTGTGTRMVADIYPGANGSWPEWPAGLGRQVLFRARSPGTGRELWISDGTAAGTRLLADLEPGPGESSPAFLTEMDGFVCFAATTTASGSELWRTDGTAAGTAMVRDLAPMPGVGSQPERFTRVGSRLFFVANDSMLGQELFVTDGTAAGTQRVLDINPGGGSSSPSALTAVGDRLFFLAADAQGTGLWVSDGTAAGTLLVRAFSLEFNELANLTAFGDTLLFSAVTADGRELWCSDGTTAGTRQVKDLFAGPPSGLPENGTGFIRWIPGTSVALFAASDGRRGLELWATDGRSEGTRLLWDLVPGPEGGLAGTRVPPAIAGSHVLWEADGGTGVDLWSLDVMALAVPHGRACPGTGGLRPVLAPSGDPPAVGNMRFAMTCSRARPGGYAILPLALRPAVLGVGGCEVLFDPATVFAALVAPVDAAGVALFPLPIPFEPLLRSATWYGQAAVLDPQGAAFGLLALSNALKVVVGDR